MCLLHETFVAKKLVVAVFSCMMLTIITYKQIIIIIIIIIININKALRKCAQGNFWHDGDSFWGPVVYHMAACISIHIQGRTDIFDSIFCSFSLP
jgi:hypothetical protein